jgi:catechol 2,3-dioxygenase-like lactoylglutathione lyase family enzyme
MMAAQRGAAAQQEAFMDFKLEVVVIPVSDVDRAKQFYTEKLGFNVDVDQRFGEKMRVVQLTPPGSACSVTIGTGMEPGLQLVVSDIEAARADVVKRGLEPGNIQHIEEGVWSDGKGGPWNSFFFFKDPDGNNWAVQEKPEEGLAPA